MSDYYFTTKQLQEMQKKSFNEKYQITIAKIMEIISKTNGKIYIAFSGGKDSSVLLDIVARLWSDFYKDKYGKLYVAMANTNNEYSGMLKHANDFIKYIENKHNIEIEFIITNPEKNMRDIFVEYGYPVVSKSVSEHISRVRKIMDEKNITFDMIKNHLEPTIENAEYLRKLGFNNNTTASLCGLSSKNEKVSSITKIPKRWLPLLYAPFKVSQKCCYYLKKLPSKEIQDKLKISVLLGEMAQESKLRESAYKKTGCVNDLGNGKYKGKPMGFWTEQDIYKYIKWQELPIFKYYGDVIEKEDGTLTLSGMLRTGCKACLFGCQFNDNGIHQLKYLEPRVWEILKKPIDEGGFGYEEVIRYLNDNCGCNIEL